MDNNEKSQGYELDIGRLVMVLWRRAWLILLTGVLFAACTFGYAWYFVAPTYKAEAKFYVNNYYDANHGAYSSSQIEGAQALARTYMVILRSRPVLEQVQSKTGLPYTQNQLKNMISAVAVNETEVFELTVKCEDYLHALAIAEAFTEALPGAISQVVEGSSIRVVEYPVEEPKQIGPNYVMYGFLGAVLGVALCAAIIVVLHLAGTGIETEEYLTSKYEDIPLLAVIPCDDAGKGSHYKGNYYKGNYYKGYYASGKSK